MNIFGTVVVLLICMPVTHAVLFGTRDLGTATFYYWLIGAPTLIFLVPLVGFPLLALLRGLGVTGVAAILLGTVICGLIAGVAISRAHGVIPEVIAVAVVYGCIGGLVWTSLAQRVG